MFNADIAESDQIRLAEWKQRSLFEKLQERIARLGAYWL
jgi:hypothetical protein